MASCWPFSVCSYFKFGVSDSSCYKMLYFHNVLYMVLLWNDFLRNYVEEFHHKNLFKMIYVSWWWYILLWYLFVIKYVCRKEKKYWQPCYYINKYLNKIFQRNQCERIIVLYEIDLSSQVCITSPSLVINHGERHLKILWCLRNI